ncbi:hypothetical protein BGZ60DRAFT_438219 [Tricladium varicosporioides]|nr:hypothetical protein BGZ60DRAFT_438219 [Hymenoscyphus varicosporioides]
MAIQLRRIKSDMSAPNECCKRRDISMKQMLAKGGVCHIEEGFHGKVVKTKILELRNNSDTEHNPLTTKPHGRYSITRLNVVIVALAGVLLQIDCLETTQQRKEYKSLHPLEHPHKDEVMVAAAFTPLGGSAADKMALDCCASYQMPLCAVNLLRVAWAKLQAELIVGSLPSMVGLSIYLKWRAPSIVTPRRTP